MADPPWKVFETYVAKLLGLDATCSSGSTWHDKGDAVSRDRNDPFPLYAECKLTEHASKSVTLRDLNTGEELAALVGKRFIMPIRFHLPGPPVGEHDYVVLSLHDFKELLDGYRVAVLAGRLAQLGDPVGE
jgi:hypothetical protein